MIEMIARARVESSDIDRGDLLALAALVRFHEDATVGLAYGGDGLAPVALEAYWEVDADDSQQ